MYDVDPNLGLVHLLERVAQSLDRTLDVGFDDEVQVGLLASLDAIEQVVQAHVRLRFLSSEALAQRALFGELAGIAFVFEYAELVTGDRHARQAEDLCRVGRECGRDVLATRIDQRTDAAVRGASDYAVAGMQCTALDEHRGDGATAFVEVSLDDEAGSKRIGIGLQLEHVSLEDDGLEQVVDMHLLLCRHLDEHVGAAPFLGDDAVLGELLAHTVGVRTGFVDLVDSHDDGNIGCFRVVDSLNGLRHDTVVGGNDEHDNVGDLGTAGTHCRERFVARGVDEGDLLAVDFDDGCTDMLGDAARLARDNAGMANRVEQRGLAVVDVAHDRDYRRTRFEVVVGVVIHDRVLLLGRNDANLASEIVRDQLNEVVAHGLGQRQHLTEHEQPLDDVVGLHLQHFGKLCDRGTLGNLDDGLVEHEFGVETLLDGLELGALTRLGLTLLLALLTTPFALMSRCSGDCSARIGEHLVALQLLNLYSHFRVTVLAVRLCLKFWHELLVALLLLALLAALLCRALRLTRLRGGCSLLLDALLLGFDLAEQRIEIRLSGF